MGGITRDLATITDRLPDDGETVVASGFTEQPGGKGASAAVACYRLTRPNPKGLPQADDENGVRVRIVGAVGADEFGGPMKDNLLSCGVNVDGVRVIEGQATAVNNIILEKDSGANRIMQYPGAAYALESTEFVTPESLGGGVAPDLLISQLEIRRDTVEQALRTANRAEIEVMMKPSPAFFLLTPLYRMISHLIMNESEASLLSDCSPVDSENENGWSQIAEYFHNLGVNNVVITLGEKGAYYSNEGGASYVEAEKNCTVLDTSGAGYHYRDSFVGAYAASYIEQKQKGEWDIEAAVRYGCKAAARVIEHLGCLHKIPWADEVDAPRYAKDIEETQQLV
ncbi:MAG: hypothetical protein Q9191_002936 [Dirinaria sp. TL-2023a]